MKLSRVLDRVWRPNFELGVLSHGHRKSESTRRHAWWFTHPGERCDNWPSAGQGATNGRFVSTSSQHSPKFRSNPAQALQAAVHIRTGQATHFCTCRAQQLAATEVHNYFLLDLGGQGPACTPGSLHCNPRLTNPPVAQTKRTPSNTSSTLRFMMCSSTHKAESSDRLWLPADSVTPSLVSRFCAARQLRRTSPHARDRLPTPGLRSPCVLASLEKPRPCLKPLARGCPPLAAAVAQLLWSFWKARLPLPSAVPSFPAQLRSSVLQLQRLCS